MQLSIKAPAIIHKKTPATKIAEVIFNIDFQVLSKTDLHTAKCHYIDNPHSY